MSIEKVRSYFKQFGMEDRIIEFPVSSATVELAAQALNCEPAHIAKTMAFMIGGPAAQPGEEHAILIVTAGDMKIDNAKYKAEFSKKAKMLTADELISLVGHAAGGVCPFAISRTVSVYLDVSLKRFEKVFPAAGSDNSAIGLTIPELEKYSNSSKWIDVCKPYSL